MSENSRQQARGAASQWNTVNELMKLAPDSLDEDTRKKVRKDAQSARRSLDACSAMPESDGMDELSNKIDTVIEESSAA